jgi:hypothetical protein
MHYETLRKIKSGDRALDATVIEQIAKAAGVEPTYFVEYRLLKARDLFDPKVVGFDQAAENLRAYLAVPAKSRAVKATARPQTA